MCILIKYCNYLKRTGYCWARIGKAEITRAGIVTGGKIPGEISQPGKPRPEKRLLGSRLTRPSHIL